MVPGRRSCRTNCQSLADRQKRLGRKNGDEGGRIFKKTLVNKM